MRPSKIDVSIEDLRPIPGEYRGIPKDTVQTPLIYIAFSANENGSMYCLLYLQLDATKTAATTKIGSGRCGKDDVTFSNGRRIGCVGVVVGDIKLQAVIMPRVKVVQKIDIFYDGGTTARSIPWFINLSQLLRSVFKFVLQRQGEACLC